MTFLVKTCKNWLKMILFNDQYFNWQSDLNNAEKIQNSVVKKQKFKNKNFVHYNFWFMNSNVIIINKRLHNITKSEIMYPKRLESCTFYTTNINNFTVT